MARRSNRVIPFSRDYRRPPKWTMGLGPPPRRRPGLGAFLRRRRPASSLAALLAALLALPTASDSLLALAAPIPANGGSCRIYRIIDGDTVSMWCPGRGSERVRLEGFDTPELFSPSCASEYLKALGAKWALRLALWRADRVALVRSGTDSYGRALASVYLDDLSLARWMIATGHARPYEGGPRPGWCA